jgi:hypothetical protein
MFIYSVTFPFEVDAEHGQSSLVYPSLKAARAAAADEVAAYLANEHHYLVRRAARDGKIVVEIEKEAVVRLTPGAVCSIINSRGGQYLAQSYPSAPLNFPVPEDILAGGEEDD